MKTCFKCKSKKDLSEFYRHPRMSDGHLNKCKTCAKLDAATRRVTHPEVCKEIDKRKYLKRRQNLPASYWAEVQKKNRSKFPIKYKSRTTLGNAIRDQKIKRQPCQVCGDPKSEGHHSDYRKPLNVIWLCSYHHHTMHRKHNKKKLLERALKLTKTLSTYYSKKKGLGCLKRSRTTKQIQESEAGTLVS